jgi:elongator complex protein 3
LTRVVRDIPADYIVEGSRASNLRETVQQRLAATGRRCRCIRCREVRDATLDLGTVDLRLECYETGAGLEHFLAIETGDGQVAGFLRLLLPWTDGTLERPAELEGCALIRELHVYGPALHIGATGDGETQHRGLGGRLLAAAEQAARAAGWRQISVIAALGTEAYYRRRGFALGELYMHKAL